MAAKRSKVSIGRRSSHYFLGPAEAYSARSPRVPARQWSARGSGVSPRGICLSPRGSGLSLRGSGLGPCGSGLSPRGNGAGLRCTGVSPRGIRVVLRGISLSLRGTRSRLLQFVVGRGKVFIDTRNLCLMLVRERRDLGLNLADPVVYCGSLLPSIAPSRSTGPSQSQQGES